MKKFYVAIVSCAIALSACQSSPTKEQTSREIGSKEQSGMVIGAIVGGVVGHQVGGGRGQTIATILGALAGAMIGGSIGRSMDDTDRLKTTHTLETVRTGVSSEWKNPDTGIQYIVTPTRTYETTEGPCREYTVDATVAGTTDTIYGTACRQPDGSWKVQN